MPQIIPVSDRDDPRIEPYRDVRDRDLRGRDGFMAEGATVLGNAVGQSRHRFQSLLVAEPKLAGLKPVLAQLPDETPIYTASPDVMSDIAGFHIHRGVLAYGERRPDCVPASLLAQLPERALVVALFGISNHDNLGGIFRNAVAFGADAVLLDPSCCDPLYRKTIRVSVGASLICPFARANSDTALMQAIKATSLKPVALSLRGEADIGRMAAAQSGIALLIGSEGHGLPDAVLTGSEGFRIPMAPGFDSLNAATATGIALHIAASALGKLGNG